MQINFGSPIYINVFLLVMVNLNVEISSQYTRVSIHYMHENENKNQIETIRDTIIKLMNIYYTSFYNHNCRVR